MNDACAGSRPPEDRGRLALAAIVSAAIHVAALIGAEATRSPAVVVDAYRQPQLVAHLVENKIEIAVGVPAPPEPDRAQATPSPPEPPESSGPSSSEQRQARFTLPPDFSVLESYPVPFGHHLVVRIEILASGLPGNITVSESDTPIPETALEALQTALRLARYQPAVIDGVAVASTLEIAIDIDGGNQDGLSPIPLAAGKPRFPGPQDPAARR